MTRLSPLFACINPFLAAILATVALASLLPARGDATTATDNHSWFSKTFIARLLSTHSANAIWRGMNPADTSARPSRSKPPSGNTGSRPQMPCATYRVSAPTSTLGSNLGKNDPIAEARSDGECELIHCWVRYIARVIRSSGSGSDASRSRVVTKAV
jgi:hypothetical protein